MGLGRDRRAIRSSARTRTRPRSRELSRRHPQERSSIGAVIEGRRDACRQARRADLRQLDGELAAAMMSINRGEGCRDRRGFGAAECRARNATRCGPATTARAFCPTMPAACWAASPPASRVVRFCGEAHFSILLSPRKTWTAPAPTPTSRPRAVTIHVWESARCGRRGHDGLRAGGINCCANRGRWLAGDEREGLAMSAIRPQSESPQYSITSWAGQK